MGHVIGKLTCIRTRSPAVVTLYKGRNSQTYRALGNAVNSSGSTDEHRTVIWKHTYHSRHGSHASNLSSHTMSVHIKARCEIYPRTTDVKRVPVPDDKVPWDVEFSGYSPTEYTSSGVLKQPVWADNPDPSDIEYNIIDKQCKIDRRTNCRMGETRLQIQTESVGKKIYPRNIMGRTGLCGRGCLGHWGPNHAGDPIVTRWKRDDNNEVVCAENGKPILQFVAVQRKDNLEWALPGGMVDPGENKTATIKREFGEEALNTFEATPEEKKEIEAIVEELFKSGETIYKGYVDDPRNTDNAWMETKAINFHDEDGTGVAKFKLNAGDDANKVQWMDINSSLKLYASHIDFIKATVDKHNAHW